MYSRKVKDHVYVENYFCRVFSCWWLTRGSIGTLTQFPLDQTHPFLKGFLLIGETILIIGLLSVGLFYYTTSLASTDKATTSGSKKAQLESTQLEAQISKKAQLVETQLKDDNIFDM